MVFFIPSWWEVGGSYVARSSVDDEARCYSVTVLGWQWLILHDALRLLFGWE